MSRLLPSILALSLLAVLSGAARADAQIGACLTKEERRAALDGGQLMKVGTVIHAVKGRSNREVIRVRLCRSPKGLVYVLTLLGRDGKVTRATVDATSGVVVGAR